jgi:hypothetical protein
VVNNWFHSTFAAIHDSIPNSEARRALQVPQASTIGVPKWSRKGLTWAICNQHIVQVVTLRLGLDLWNERPLATFRRKIREPECWGRIGTFVIFCKRERI